MIDYETYSKIRLYHGERGLNFAQIARELSIDPETVAKYARAECYRPRRCAKRRSKLDPFKTLISGWLERHPYSATQIFQRLREGHGYQGGLSVLKQYVQKVRPVRHPAFLTLAFAPGECAQVDWGCGGSIQLGTTRRRLSFFVMVLAYSRMIYLEFTCGEALEHFLACHQNAIEYLGGVPSRILIDYVPGHIINVLFPDEICAQLRGRLENWANAGHVRSHNFYRVLSHFSSSASSRQMGLRRHASEEAEAGGWHACKAACFIRRLISA